MEKEDLKKKKKTRRRIEKRHDHQNHRRSLPGVSFKNRHHNHTHSLSLPPSLPCSCFSFSFSFWYDDVVVVQRPKWLPGFIRKSFMDEESTRVVRLCSISDAGILGEVNFFVNESRWFSAPSVTPTTFYVLTK